MFNQYYVKYNISTVVTAQVARHIHRIYNFFKNKNFTYLQFIPCLDPLEEGPGGYRFSLNPEKYSYFLKTLFDLWYTEFIKIANLAETFGCICAPHNIGISLGIYTAAILQVAAAISNFLILEYQPLVFGISKQMLKTPLVCEEGKFLIPDSPGLGIEGDGGKFDEWRIT
ncbi:MAG: enolase C-terminal domain-like protein [Candidatus Njordarchaeales archaeon]